MQCSRRFPSQRIPIRRYDGLRVRPGSPGTTESGRCSSARPTANSAPLRYSTAGKQLWMSGSPGTRKVHRRSARPRCPYGLTKATPWCWLTSLCRHPRSCPQTCHVVWRGGVPGRIPAVLLGKLALDRSLHGRGLGGQLLFDAYQRVLSATRTVAARYLAVDAIDTAAVGFYEHYGFIRAPVEPLMRLVRPIRDIQADIDAP